MSTPQTHPLTEANRLLSALVVASLAVVCLLFDVSLAWAQSDADGLLDDLRQARTEFLTQGATLAENEERFPSGSTTVDRLRRETAEAALRFASLAEQALAHGLVPESAIATAWDDTITARQIASALWLEVGECARTVAELEALLSLEQTQERPLVVEAAEQRLMEARACVEAAAPTVAAREEAQRDHSRTRRAVGASLVGLGAAGAVVAVAFERSSSSSADRARAERTSDSRSLDQYHAAQSSARSASRNAAVAWTAAGVVAATGVTIWIASRPRGEDAQTATACVAPALAGATVRITW